jgi:predicted anti-sigma-YlaC factor YlaD
VTEGIAQLSCQELVELVTDYLEGALTPAEHALFEGHVATCEGCRNYLEQMRLTLDVLGRLEPEDVDPAAEEALLGAFRDWRSRSG